MNKLYRRGDICYDLTLDKIVLIHKRDGEQYIVEQEFGDGELDYCYRNVEWGKIGCVYIGRW